MKIVQSIEAIYEEQKILNQLLKNRVDDIFTRIKESSWHYFSRLKQLESFALKLETGRFNDPQKLEDFFACTIVVENLDQIKRVTSLIQRNFNVISKRPQSSKLTHKESSSFQFDDLRIYVSLTQEEFLPEEPIAKITFEIQVKTFLQHAWSLATHDLIYKSDEINWPKERIAYQIKAMLEQAEVTISGVNGLINVPEVLKDNYETTQQKKILKFYKEYFDLDDLPKDIVRLCKNTNEFIGALNINVVHLREILKEENKLKRGVYQKNLSPFLLVVQSVINQRPSLIQTFLNEDTSQKFKIILPKELEIHTLSIKNEVNIVKF
ncbi:hypothetical protein [Chryseobacterium sp. ISL-6]|uniref:hypothetical protein n=1 Tax=Chryseobacterium sp. ISL-6 TaxID=2819143 RepID=UPI001BE726AD|nr:hypothetical protein [Chryseobacterium sp. ISL-6]MBT2623518.1 hypothetical protein [Chryseobacterium sp. ISL-6]